MQTQPLNFSKQPLKCLENFNTQTTEIYMEKLNKICNTFHRNEKAIFIFAVNKAYLILPEKYLTSLCDIKHYD